MVYVYDGVGVLQQKKIVSTVPAMPAGIAASLTASYPNGKVEQAYKVVNRTNQKYYEVQVANPGGSERIRFDLEGKAIGKTSLAGVQPAGSQPVASAQPVTKPATQPSPVKPATSSQPVAMRGEAATTTKTTKAIEEDLDDDLGDLMEDDDLGDLIDDEDENWDDIDLGEDMDDDSDLLDGTDDLEDDLDLGEDLDDDEL